jgi:hypothetical protein
MLKKKSNWHTDPCRVGRILDGAGEEYDDYGKWGGWGYS